MQPSQSIEFYLRFLNQQLDLVREMIEGVLSVLPDSAQAMKVQAAQAAESGVDGLLKGLSKEDRPRWANQLHQALRQYLQVPDRQGAGYKLLKSIIAVYPVMREHSWSFSSDEPAIDFEGIYQRFINESRVPELFDTLVEKLTDLVESGNIDSVRVIRALEQVIATLRRSSRGSYFATRGAWEFASAAFRNFLWEALSDVPGVGAAVRAIRTTVEELDQEMLVVNSGASEEVVRLASPDALTLAAVRPVQLLQPAGDVGQDSDNPYGSNKATSDEA
jgi:hypothetical protein